MCANTESNESGRSEAVKIILDRNPAAFDSKFLSVSSAAAKMHPQAPNEP